MLLWWQILKAVFFQPQVRAFVKGLGATGIAGAMVAVSSNMILTEIEKRDDAANKKIDKLEQRTFAALSDISHSVKNTEQRVWDISREIRQRNSVTERKVPSKTMTIPESKEGLVITTYPPKYVDWKTR